MADNGIEATKKKIVRGGGGEIEEIIDEVEKRYRLFKHFDTVRHPSVDHYFVATGIKNFGEKQGELLEKKIMEDWLMLNTKLPDWIYVRAYDSRIDGMQAVIIGPPGTPYYQGLFFFDISFPSSYPASPPKLFYHSYAFDLNFNSDSYSPSTTIGDGFDLIPSSRGRGYEFRPRQNWDPKKSNILQLLVSIRHWFFNIAKPGDDRRSLMLGCEAMIQTLARPPRNFRDFVAGHFRNKAHAILMNFKAHMDQSEDMTRLFFKLLNVFEANGTYCQHHYLPHLKKEPKPKSRMVWSEYDEEPNPFTTTWFNRIKYPFAMTWSPK